MDSMDITDITDTHLRSFVLQDGSSFQLTNIMDISASLSRPDSDIGL